jgi:hypothetical protein
MQLGDSDFQTASAQGPVKDPVSDSDSQPLFADAHPGSGASFSSTVAIRKPISGEH